MCMRLGCHCSFSRSACRTSDIDCAAIPGHASEMDARSLRQGAEPPPPRAYTSFEGLAHLHARTLACAMWMKAALASARWRRTPPYTRLGDENKRIKRLYERKRHPMYQVYHNSSLDTKIKKKLTRWERTLEDVKSVLDL